MGSYFGLKIKKYDVISGKSYLAPEIGILFTDTEKVIDHDDDESKNYMYISTAGNILARLSIIGITPEKAKKSFNLYKRKKILDQTSDGEFWGNKELKTLTFSKWCQTIKEIIENDTYYCCWNVRDQSNPLYTNILESDDFLYGFPTDDYRNTQAVILSLFPKEERVVLDLTSLVYGGYYNEDDNFVQISRDSLFEERYYNESIILLTEGTYDALVLKDTLQLLHPDKVDYFSFLDFENSKTPGGAGQLVNYIKALTGAKITDKILAIFDNDSAAYDAIRTIPDRYLPKNIRYTNYPDNKYLNNYPTIGPSGNKKMNINGKAASIELYLGDDILNKSTSAYPVQWTGYIKTIGSYQGEISDKGKIQDLFNIKIKKCKESKTEINNFDWNGITSIWEHIFSLCKDYTI